MYVGGPSSIATKRRRLPIRLGAAAQGFSFASCARAVVRVVSNTNRTPRSSEVGSFSNTTDRSTVCLIGKVRVIASLDRELVRTIAQQEIDPPTPRRRSSARRFEG